MDEVITKEEGRELKIRTDRMEQLLHIQEQLDEEMMVITLKFDECMKIASKILDELSKNMLHVV